MIEQAFTELAPQVGIKAACQLLGKPRSSYYRGLRPVAIASKVGYRVPARAAALALLAEVRLNRPEQALKHAAQALGHHRGTGHRLGEAHARASQTNLDPDG